jgi:hypothetical protein
VIPKPDNCDDAHVARLQSLLDAFAAAGVGNLGLHETTCKHLAYAVADWAQRTKHKIDTEIVTANGRTYEVWHIGMLGPQYDGTLTVWPKQIGLLDGKDELHKKIEAIRKEADERVKQLLAVEQSKAAAS